MQTTVKSNGSASSRRWKILSIGLATLLIIQFSGKTFTGDCLVSFGEYKGRQYKAKETVGSKCLVESKWMRVQQHQVLFSGQSSTISDWLWIDYHDRINVLVEAPNKVSLHGATSALSRIADRSQLYFYVFQQSKYALEGKLSMAIIGGIIEPGERPEDAAVREVEEEMSLTCVEWHSLGRFRTDVNRGMGWVHSFLAMRCQSSVKMNTITTSNKAVSDGELVGDADGERQDLRKVSLTELRAAVRNGDFMEVQWSNTVALALMHPELAGSDSR
jgi:ADP-ribose pyrophosphatase YjhB (NUDIX family)